MAGEKLVFQIGFDLDSAVKDATSEWKRVQRELEAAINARPISISMDTKGLERFNAFVERTYASLEDLQDLFPEVFKETKDGEGITKRFQAMETSINAVSKEMRNLEKVWNNLSQAEKFDDDGNLTERAQELKRAYVELYQSQKTQGQTLQEITKEAINLANQEYEAQQRKKKQEEDFIRLLNLEETTLEKLQAKQGAWKQKLSQTEIGSSDWSNAIAEVQRLETKIKDLQKQIKGVATETKKTSKTKVDIDTSTFAGKLKDLENRWKALNAEQRKGAEGQALRAEWRKLSEEAGSYTSTLRSAVSAEDRLANAKSKTTQVTHRQNNAYKTQETYLQRLAKRMIAYAGVHQVFSFLRNIREVTAEFELQRVALGSIIGDLNEANKMFEQIKAAAVKSPFQIKELVTYTKQLAAYKIGTDELFETTQRLADISAGLGVSMDRLVLAYGQIRATGYLRASEVRQLTEAGIPIVEELAQKMSQLRGETVSAAEVMGMISERAISFGMVKEVFEDMTSAGGMFYKMQEKQAETLRGQWSNLQDAISIMYDEIGNTESVNNAMKGMIGLVKSLAENWKNVWIVVKSLSMAMGVYYVTMKNAAMASKALSVAESTRLSTLRATTIYMPKFLASTKLAIALTHAYRVAVIKSATATGLLSKAFWGLTKAMLSNPYALVLAGLVAIGVAIWNFSTKVKTTEERVEDLNKSITSLTSLKDNVKPLVDEFDVLSQKTNKTAEEQKRLNQVTQELARIYPEAIVGVREFGREVELSTEKIKELYKAEAQAIGEGLKIMLQANEAELKKEEARLSQLNNALVSKTYTKTTMGLGGRPITARYKYTTEELVDLAKQADESRKKIASLNNSIKEGRIALGLQKSDLKKAVDGFNTWQKELASFTEGKNLKGEEIRLFDDANIAQINKLTDATARVAEEYDKLAKEKKEVDKALKSEGAKADNDTYAKLQERLGEINEGMSGLHGFLKKYGALDLIKSDDKAQKDAKQALKDAKQALKDELSAVEKIYRRYQDLRKLKSETDTQSILAREFKGVSLTTLSKAYSPEQMIEVYQKALAEAQRLGKKDLVLEIQTKLGEFSVDEEQRKLEKSLKELSDKISRTKTAKEFFDRMLGMTGDKELSATLTLSVYGTTGDDLQKLMSKQVEEAFKNLPEGFDITKAMLGSGKFDYNLLESWIEKLPEQDRKSAQSIVENWRKTNQDIITDLYKTYEEFLSFEERKTRVVEKENAERMRIINSGLPIAEQKKLVEASQKRENKALADIAIEEFKASKDWAKSFEDLEHLATPTIERLMAKLKEFIDTQKDLTPEQFKTLTNEYKKLYDGLIARNPFKAMTDGIKEYVAATKDVKTAKNRVETAQEELRIAAERKAAAEQNFRTSQDVVTAGREYASAIEEYNKASQNAANADKGLEDGLDNQKKALNKTVQGFNAASSAISNFGSIITDITEMLGIAEDSEVGAFIKDLVKWLGIMAGVLGTVAAIIAVIEAELAPLLAIAAGIAAIGAAISFFSNAKVRRANKEIERQQKLLDQLTYSYERLEKAIEKSFGVDYISNYEKQIANLEAQQRAYLKQAEAERSKGKKADKDKIKEYEEQARDTADSIADMRSELSEYFLGTDLTSAARDFANAWIEAYKEFGSTTDAMKEKFQDMIQNMIVESFAAQVIQTALKPIFDSIDEMSKDGMLDMSEASKIVDMTNVAIGNIDTSMSVLMQALANAGISVRDMGTELTGISRNIATASEESILGLAAGINTQNFYISQVPPKLDVIIGLLQGGSRIVGDGVNMQDLVTIQNQHLAYLPNIAQNTADTVARCERAALACERVADNLDRVIKPRGTQSSYTLSTSL